MNNTLKYIGLLAILPLFTVALTTNYVIEADAEKSEGSKAPGRVGAKSYGSKNNNIVCGDRLCSETGGRTAQIPSEEPEKEKMEERWKQRWKKCLKNQWRKKCLQWKK